MLNVNIKVKHYTGMIRFPLLEIFFTRYTRKMARVQESEPSWYDINPEWTLRNRHESCLLAW